MSVLSYLQALSSKLVLSSDESISIAVSLGFLKTNLGRWSHSDEIKDQEAFGSYRRETILPRKYDEGSDVDYMIVFKNTNNYAPETYRRDYPEMFHFPNKLIANVLEILCL